MSKKHDENKDVRLVSKVAKIDVVRKTIETPVSVNIGIRLWGRIDFLTNYCGYSFIRNNSIRIVTKASADNKDDAKRRREAKKLAKEHTLTDKRRKK